MGFTGLARWTNAPTTGLELINQNIMRNHQGRYIGKWSLSVKSFRSTFGSTPGFQVAAERSMCALAMNENVFVLLEDPTAPTRADVLQQAEASGSTGLNQTVLLAGPPHYRTTFLTLSPPGALEQLLGQLKARWVPVRQPGGSTAGSQPSRSQGTAGQQLTIDGHVFAIGNDWLVRAGNVILAGGAVKGMFLEAEYLPLPGMHTESGDGTSELLSNLLTSVLPNIPDARIVAVTISEAQLEEVLWDREEEQAEQQNPPEVEKDDPDDIFVTGSDDHESPTYRKGDWVGVDRDRISAFLIMGALRSEGIL
ncbi:hypothetical protein BXZ70DRAFT_1004139 [Cristinia sonorae]|uniref:Mediator of RNA polymerase II transcription subunit 20 n=1 Tax=Cristinia sonorae TaxID=1940300 RepID=A0A8K0XTF2_9AGAR|nr:hypothetical protein BXZ70DRAFT_1004139 [Cristinia sonorae]